MAVVEQETPRSTIRSSSRPSVASRPALPMDMRAARASLRAQIARLERELSGVIAKGFPHIAPAKPDPHALRQPRLLSLAELETVRDGLVEQIAIARRGAAARAEHVRRSLAQLDEMRRNPARSKLVRVAVVDLEEGTCGFWEVRPRLGLIGMLAGWWQVKLSSGCPLGGGLREWTQPLTGLSLTSRMT